MNKYDTLNISEDFYSVQGEGKTSGEPAYFIRLKACNLMCGGRDGSLMEKGEATWWCDTEYVWRKGLEKKFNYLVDISWTCHCSNSHNNIFSRCVKLHGTSF